MSDKAESYMRGWRAGYHNARLATYTRITEMIKEFAEEESPSEILRQIQEAYKDELYR